MRILLKHIALDIQLRRNMAQLVDNNCALTEIKTSIYGLPQVGKLSQNRLVKHLASHQCTNMPCMFVHDINGIIFTLVVDDFLINYNDKAVADQLTTALRELYKCTIDMSIPGLKDKNQKVSQKSLIGRHNPNKNFFERNLKTF